MRKRFFIVFSLFMILLPLEVASDLAFLYDFPASLRREILSDFSFLDTIQGSRSTPLHQKIFGEGSLDGRRYTQFLRQYISSFTFSKTDSPYQVTTDGRGNLYIFASYLHFARHVSPFGRAINFIHEAHHSSGSFHHTKCPTPFRNESGGDIRTTIGQVPLAGLFACDNSYDGSYGIEIIVAKNIERYCENCSMSLRREAGEHADDLLKRIVDPEARRALIEDLYEDQPVRVSSLYETKPKAELVQ